VTVSLELIGAGFGRTGTLSLKGALESLGLGPCHHMLEVFSHPETADDWYAAAVGDRVDWPALLAGYRACVDWPSCAFWREISAAFPDAKVLLSVRDPERWYQSVYETIYAAISHAKQSPDPAAQDRLRMADRIVFQHTFDGRFSDRAHAIGVFERHIEDVQKSLPSERLLVYEVSSGWTPLCNFLGLDEPEEDFPHANSRDAFQQTVRSAVRR
jgi:hypothetical protein